MRCFSITERLLHSCFVCLVPAVLSGFVTVMPVFAVPLNVDATFGPGLYGDWFPLATLDPGDILTGTLTVSGSGNASASAAAEIDFNGNSTIVTEAFTIPGAESSSLSVNFQAGVTAIPPTLTNIVSGAGFISATSTYPDGAYYPHGTAPPVFGIAAIPDYFH